MNEDLILVAPISNDMIQILAARNMEITHPKIGMCLESFMDSLYYYLGGNGKKLRWYIGVLYSVEVVVREMIKRNIFPNIHTFTFRPTENILTVKSQDQINQDDYQSAIEEVNFLLHCLHKRIPMDILLEVLWFVIAGLSLRALNFNTCIYR